MARILLVIVLTAGLIVMGCSKKEEEIKAIEQEAAQDDAAAVMDSLEGAGEKVAGESAEAIETTPAKQPVKAERPAQPDYSDLSGFVVQIGSYADYDLAVLMAEKYKNREFPAFVQTADIGGETFYRLRVGVYETFDEAKQVGELLADRFSAEFWIDRNR